MQSINVVLEGAPLFAVLVEPVLGLQLASAKRQDLYQTIRTVPFTPGNVLEYL